MKTNHSFTHLRAKGATVATFGTACLVRQPDGKYELIGGSANDAAAAREWCSFFAHEVVFTSVSRQPLTLPQRRRSAAGRAVTVTGRHRRRGPACASKN
jgi:hypothetical protein